MIGCVSGPFQKMKKEKKRKEKKKKEQKKQSVVLFLSFLFHSLQRKFRVMEAPPYETV